MKKPTQKQKIEMYEKFIDNLALYAEVGNAKLLWTLIDNAAEFSYAHRVGNGEYEEEQQEKIIAAKFWNLTTVPDVFL
jgi:hypothetical protein